MKRKPALNNHFRIYYYFIMVFVAMMCISSTQALAVDKMILPLGDSITQANGAHNSYRRSLWFMLVNSEYQVDFVGSWDTNHPSSTPPNPDFDLDNEGHWGLRTDELLDGLPTWLQSSSPDIVLLHAGSNDMFQGTTVTSALDNLKAIIDVLRLDNPDVTILLAQLIPTSRSVIDNALITDLNNGIPGVVAEKNTAQSPVILVDHNTGFDPDLHTYDDIHPNDEGEAIMAQRWFDSLAGILPEPTDDIAPSITGVEIAPGGMQLIVSFSEPLDSLSATDIANYSIDLGINVLGATLESDLSTVTLDVSQLTEDINYTLYVTGVLDLANPPNAADDFESFIFITGFAFSDNFERPDGPVIGNGWIEKGPEFSLLGGEVVKSSGGSYKNNIVYRPAGETLQDMKASIEFYLKELPARYPQLHFRVNPQTVGINNSLDSYFFWVVNENLVRLSRSVGSDRHTTLVHSTPSEPLVANNTYRIRVTAEGGNPVVLNGYLDKWTGTDWLEIAFCTFEDSSSLRMGAGTIGFSDNNKDFVVYDEATYQPLGASNAPFPAINPSPTTGATGVLTNTQLGWDDGGGATSYDVYFGTSNPPLYVGEQTSTSYDPGILLEDTQYFWRIDSINSSGTTTGSEWSFQTESAVPPVPDPAINPSPAIGATDVLTDAQLSWSDGGGATSYDIYFGTSNPPLYVGEQAGTSYDPGILLEDTQYFWRIDSINSSGTTTGSQWSFQTETGVPPVPNPAINPSPATGTTNVLTDVLLSWNDGGGATSYDVYFGTSNPPLYVGEQTGTSYDPGTLSEDTQYFWRIDSINSNGTTTGSEWDFQTKSSGSFTFSDDFERPDGPVIGNGWIEKGPEFSLLGGEVVKSRGGSYKNNIVYRPAGESFQDMQAGIEFYLTKLPARYPQLHVRVDPQTVGITGTLDSYFFWVVNENLVRISRSIGSDRHTTLVFATPSEPLVANNTYRIRVTATGENPVVLNGYLDKWTGADWLEIASCTYEDSSTQQMGAGTVGFSDNNKDFVVYDSFIYEGF